MSLQLPAVDVPPQPWTGRFDGDGPGHRRWWQAVNAVDETPESATRARRAALVGFASDEGVRRNKGRTGASAAPAALRKALGPLAFHLDRTVADVGDVVVSGTDLEAGQERLGQAVAALLDAGHQTVV